jgi:hypothetical protein
VGRIGGHVRKPRARLVIEDIDRERIGEDHAALEGLMHGAMGRRTPRGLTGLSGLHRASG